MPINSLIDLHLHTFYSDGRASPKELVDYAVSIGMKIIAITDHDNARGSREARSYTDQLNLNIIPAIELTCRWEDSQAPPGQTDIDVLGYYLDLDRPDFQVFEAKILNDVHERTDICCWYLIAAGCPLTREEVLRENPYYAGILPLAMAVLHKGYASTYDQALEQVNLIWKKVRPSSFSIDQVIKAIRQSGGVPVLAHPTIVPWPTGWLNAEAIASLVELGLEGIEIAHPRLDAPARQYFQSLAKKFDLLITGGSDDHGWPEGFPHMGSQLVTMEMVQKLKERAENIQLQVSRNLLTD